MERPEEDGAATLAVNSILKLALTESATAVGAGDREQLILRFV